TTTTTTTSTSIPIRTEIVIVTMPTTTTEKIQTVTLNEYVTRPTTTTTTTTTTTITTPELSIEFDSSLCQCYYADDTRWYDEGITVYRDGEIVSYPDLEYSVESPAAAYDGENIDYEIEVTYTEYISVVNNDGYTVSWDNYPVSVSAVFDVRIGKRGDANCDHVVNIRDVATIENCLANGKDIDLFAEYEGYDGVVEDYDASNIAYDIVNNLVNSHSETKLERKGSSSAKLSIGNVAARPGHTVKVPIKVECGDNFESGAFVIGWDSSELYNWSLNYADDISIASTEGENCYAVAVYDDSAIADGEIATLELTIPADAKAGDTYEIYFTDVESFAEFGGEDLADTVSVESGSVTAIAGRYSVSEGEELDLSEYSMFDITTSDSAVAEVVDNTLKGIKSGLTYIQFVNDGYEAEARVVVMSPTEIELMVGEQTLIYISEYPYYDGDSGIELKVVDDSVVNIEGIVLTALAEGTTKIYATNQDGENIYSGTVTVKERTAETTTPDIDVPTTTTHIVNIDEVAVPKDDYVDDDMPTYSLYLSNVSAEPGETVKMPVRIKCDDNFNSMKMDLSWGSADFGYSDPSVDEANGTYCDCDYIYDHIYDYNSSITGLEINVKNYSDSAIADGEIAYINFTIPENAENGTVYDIDISSVDRLIDFDGNNLSDTVSVHGGSITVTDSNSRKIHLYEKDTAVIEGDLTKYTDIVSSDESVAYVEDGVIYSVSSGVTEITLFDEEGTFTITVYVHTPEYFEIDTTVENSKRIFVSSEYLTYTSSNTDVATFDDIWTENGYYDGVYGHKRGTATISAYDPHTSELVWTGVVNVKYGEKYGDYLYYEKYDSDDDGVYDFIEIIDCDKTATSVHIPAEIEGLPVKYISSNAFYECTELAEITADEEVTRMVDADYFQDTAWFKNEQAENTFVILSNALIDASTYDGEALEIPDGIEVIVPAAFKGNTTLKNVVIPESVEVADAAFSDSEVSESITIENPDCEIETLFTWWSAIDTYAPKGLVIYGHADSTAQTYAEKNGLTFVLIGSEADVTTTVTTELGETTGTTISEDTTTSASGETPTTTTVTGTAPLAGDANNDGDVSVRDCATIARFLAENKKDELPAWADYNGDGEISVRDAAALSRDIATDKLEKIPFAPAVTTPAETTAPVTTTTPETTAVNTEVTTTTTVAETKVS
ncbi:MAG: leucine-rich repeat protein, partial [Oscillospiraceae bacterium]|nr:leucine-rich repeat protein [Oscillospiraceae bacterium]